MRLWLINCVYCIAATCYAHNQQSSHPLQVQGSRTDRLRHYTRLALYWIIISPDCDLIFDIMDQNRNALAASDSDTYTDGINSLVHIENDACVSIASVRGVWAAWDMCSSFSFILYFFLSFLFLIFVTLSLTLTE